MPTQSLAISAGLLAGLVGGLQIAVNGAFGRRIGVLEASAFASVIAVACFMTAMLLARHGLGSLSRGFSAPWWMWLGGICSFVLVTSVTFAGPRLGGFATAGLLIAGQLTVVLLVDTFGLFGLDRVPLTTHRLIGLPLLAVSAFLILRR